jgi:hypothetical protein
VDGISLDRRAAYIEIGRADCLSKKKPHPFLSLE